MKINIFEYEDFRKFLKDLYEERKRVQPSFSFRFFAREAGFASPNFLKLVMDGKRGISQQSITKFVKGLKLNQQEAEFFSNLVGFNLAKSSEEKSRSFEQMAKSRRYRKFKHLEKEQFEYLSHWYYAAVRELVTLKDFQEDPAWIANKLVPSIRPRQAAAALKLLLRLKLLERGENGELRQVDRVVSSGAEVKSVAAKSFHREMLHEAAEALDRFRASERDISAVMLAIPEGKIAELKAKVAQFRKELLASMEKEGEKADQLMELNIQLFPLTKGGDSK